MERFEREIEVDARVGRVFELLSDFESFPRWMRGVKDVRRTGRGLTRWRAGTAVGMDAVWEAETVVFEPERRIAWRSFDGDIDTDGEVLLAETRRGTTLVRVVLGYNTPGGRSGAAAARFFGRSPAMQLEEDLERFARLAEREGAKRPGRRVDRVDVERREASSPPPKQYRASLRERREERERRFDEALREARLSQLESMRRYDEERERERVYERERASVRDEGRRAQPYDDWSPPASARRSARVSTEGETARLRAEDRRTRAGRPDEYERVDERADDGRGYRPRYALSPRERGALGLGRRETEERGAGQDYSERLRRRGVDRLLDEEAPSRRFGRRRD